MKIAYITDSGTGKSIAEFAKDGILSVPLQISDGTTTYQDMETFSKNDCTKGLNEGKVYTTSQPSPGIIQECFESLKEQGVELIIAVPICNGLSGTISTMTMIAQDLGLHIICIDTYCTAVVQDYLIHRIKELYEMGKSDLEIKLVTDKIIDSCDTLIVPKSLKQLAKGGRLTPMAAKLAGLLKIIPVLRINKSTSGRIDNLEQVRTFRKALNRVVDILAEQNPDENTFITIAHVNNIEDSESLYHTMQERFPLSKIQVIELCNVVSCHTGLGCIAIQAFQAI